MLIPGYHYPLFGSDNTFLSFNIMKSRLNLDTLYL